MVEGFLLHYCDKDSAKGCMESEDRFSIFSGDRLPPGPGPRHQPCPMTESGLGNEVLVGGRLPAGLAYPRNRRAVVLGTVSRRTVTIPLVEAKGSSGTYIDLVSDLVLDDVTVLAVYDSRCEFPH